MSDTLNIAWGDSKSLNMQVNLKSIPLLDSISIYTVVYNQFTPLQQSYQLNITAKISDKDNDIDTVYVQNTQLSLMKPLGYDAANKIYLDTLSTSDLNISDIEGTIGLDFNIIVKDIFNNYFSIGSSKVTRVIETGVSIESPNNDTTVSSTPIFKWDRYRTGYPFTFMIEIYINNFANSQRILQIPNISSDSLSYQLNSPLSSNNYYWVIWVIDQFQNRSRSLPATFQVK